MICWLAAWSGFGVAAAQSVQFGQPAPNAFPPSSTIAPPNTISSPSSIPSSSLSSPIGTPSFSQPSFGTPAPTQPYAANPYPASGYPSGTATPWSPPAATAPNTWFPNNGAATPYSTPNPYGTTPNGAYPNYGYEQPGSSVVFPNGITGPGSAIDPYVEPFRFLQHPRLSDTWLYGDDSPSDLQIHDIEFAITGAWPNFFGGTQPLYITPTFLLHLWNGPNSMPADLPPNAYSAFIDFFWASDPQCPVGAEFGAAVGAFTDFETFNDNSIRVMGEGFGVVRLTPTLTAKAGVWYLNRNDLKLLPAGGLVWQPNPQTKFDILFPNPKFTRYLNTIGTNDVWWYVAGEYGGGAWTIERTDGSSDRVDINDIRVRLGFDWINQRNWRGYFEIGYVFNREVVYVVNPADNFSPNDTFLIGGGFAF